MKFFKKKDSVYIAVGSCILLSFLGFLGVLMIDDNSLFNGVICEILLKIVHAFGCVRINISTTIFVAFLGSYGATAVSALLLILNKNARQVLEKKLSKKASKITVFSICAAIFVLGWLAAFALCAIKNAKVWQMFLVWAYFLISLACVAIGFALIYLAVEILSRAFKPNIKATTTSEGVAKTANGMAVGEAQASDNGGEIFPGLKAIDKQYKKADASAKVFAKAEQTYTLSQIAEGLQAFLSERCQLYYDMKMLRSFIAGMATSRLIILEGLSGTGKSSLPRYFSEYVGSKTFFAPVQSTWRDRSDLLGFYNDFSHVFKETNFLKRLYESSYTPNKLNMMVLDEMNLSRVEYYFADFLSVMEYPAEDWKVTLMSAINPESAPAKLDNGAVVVPANTWFVGTANKDDSTFTITDKVYDRAVVLEFNDKNVKIPTTASPEPISLSPAQLTDLFQAAKTTEKYRLTDADIAKFDELAEFVYDLFEIRFGNRIMNQIINFVPVFVALGGTKEEALDLMFCRKILHKLDGRFEDYVREGLARLQNKVEQLYGAGVLADTEKSIRRLIKKLS